jgi:hypothetical protein
MSHIAKLDTSKFEFPVEMVNLYTLGTESESQLLSEVPPSMARGLRRTDTNEILGIHGSKYQLVPYKTQLDPINDALVNSGLDLSDIDVIDHIFEGGARMEREIIFNKHRFDVGPGQGYRPGQPSYYNTDALVGDTVALVLRMRNSYDGGWSYESSFGGKRLRCLNGVWVLDAIARTRGKHTVNLSNTAAVEKIKLAITMMDTMKDMLTEMTRIRVQEDQVRELFKKTLAYVPRADKETPEFGDKTLGHLMNLWDRNATELGRTKWAVYNAATEWATHPEDTMRPSSQPHRVRALRESKVTAMLKTDHWSNIDSLRLAA